VHPSHSRHQQPVTGQAGPEKQQRVDDAEAWLSNPAACGRVTGHTDDDLSGEAV
jgi:hypothetical protein